MNGTVYISLPISTNHRTRITESATTQLKPYCFSCVLLVCVLLPLFCKNKRVNCKCACALLSAVRRSCGNARSLDDNVQLTVVLDLPQVHN